MLILMLIGRYRHGSASVNTCLYGIGMNGEDSPDLGGSVNFYGDRIVRRFKISGPALKCPVVMVGFSRQLNQGAMFIIGGLSLYKIGRASCREGVEMME